MEEPKSGGGGAFAAENPFQLEELTPEELELQVANGLFYKEVKHKEHFAIHPYWLTTLRQGVNEELRRLLGKWNAKLKAYVVGFKDVTSDTRSAAINQDHKWIHIDIFVTFYLYKPEVGQVLNGILRKIGLAASTCTLFNVFSATVFPGSKNEMNTWSLGDELTFEIYSVENKRKGPIIRATTRGHAHAQISNEYGNWEDLPNDTTKPKANKKNTSIQFSYDNWETEEPANNEANEGFIEVDESSIRPRKKKKKSRKSESNVLPSPEPEPTHLVVLKVDVDVDSDSSPKKKKKKKARKSVSFKEETIREPLELESPKKKSKKRKIQDLDADETYVIPTVEEIEIEPPRKKHKKKNRS